MYSAKLFPITTVCLILTPICLSESEIPDSDVLHRTRRQLLFPNSTLLQLNAGVGTPTPIKTININWAFQANFQLPWNRSQIPLDILQANAGFAGMSRKKREINDAMFGEHENNEDYENDARLYHFYKYVEDVLDGYGHNGSSCVLRALCDLGAEPLYNDDEEDLLHELASFILNPGNNHIDDDMAYAEATPYVGAFNSGESVEYCFNKYNNCSLSLVDMFTKLNDVS